MAKAQKNSAKSSKTSKSTTKAKTQVAFENPYRAGGSYHAVVEALRTLGVNKMHSFEVVIPAVRKALGDSWKAFAAKENRNEETGKDASGRIIQNCSVVARKDYGAPLREKGFEVRFTGREKQVGIFKL